MMNSPNMWARALEMYAGRNEPENVRPLGQFAWRSLLFFSGMAIIGICFFATTVFWNVMESLSGTSGATSRPPVTLDKTSLENAVKAIEARQHDFEAAKNNPTPVVPPSK